jgi:two-component system sensor histidine kinase KdpD
MVLVDHVLSDHRRAEALFRAQAEHRIKTSLSLISGWAATLDDDWERLGPVRRREGIAIIRRASDDLATQTARLLQQTRAELLSFDLQPTELDLGALLDLTAHALGGMSEGHRVLHATSGVGLRINVDATALHEVLAHLVENALKYSPAGTDIVLHAAGVGDGMIAIDVVDAGMGIPEDVDVFAAFQRGADRGTPGVGLGLYIVRNLVHAMAGSVDAHRNAGPGSTFTVLLPAHA